MNSKEIMESVKSADFTEPPAPCCILEPDAPKPAPPDFPAQTLTHEDLVLTTPTIVVADRSHALSPQLEEYCHEHPIVVLQRLTTVLEFDLKLFYSKTLVERIPHQTVEIRFQEHQGPDENWDPTQMKHVWKWGSQPSKTTIAGYAEYQFRTHKKQDGEGGGVTNTMSSDSSSMDSFFGSVRSVRKKKKSKRLSNNRLKLCTNVDLSDGEKWSSQLNELEKLPAFTHLASPKNMLSHVGSSIFGMNTVQLFMKVRGCRTPGHQANNNFCSVNINIGPGDCEWFAVPEKYWGAIEQLCVKNDVDYLHGSWWPNMKDLFDANIPVYRFIQQPGDLVWVNIGCVHWIYSRGCGNNIAWNVGPLTARQYSWAIERYEWNKLQHFKSLVPMIHLSWNLARDAEVSDRNFFDLIKNCMSQSLRHVMATLQFIKSKNVEVEFRGRDENPSHYCKQCDEEVFNLLFIRKNEKKPSVFCLYCAIKENPSLSGYKCLEEYEMDTLEDMYDSFKFHSPPPPVLPPALPSQHDSDSVIDVSFDMPLDVSLLDFDLDVLNNFL